MPTPRMLSVVMLVCLALRVGGDTQIATWTATTSTAFTATVVLPVTSGAFARGSTMTGSGNLLCDLGGGQGKIITTGSLPLSNPGCTTSVGFKMSLNTDTSAPINITGFSLVGVGGFTSASSCPNFDIATVDVNVCTKSSFNGTFFNYQGRFILDPAGLYITGPQNLSDTYLNPGASLDLVFPAYGTAYYVTIQNIKVYGLIGCKPATITGGSSTCTTSKFIGATCTVSCPAGYFPNSNRQATCTELVGGYGTWSPSLGTTCLLNSTYCPISNYPPSPGNGTLQTCVQSLYGTCTTTCNAGYTLTQAPNAFCLPTTLYNGTAGLCTPTSNYCPLPAVPAHGSRGSCSQFINGICSFTCDPGYIITTPTRTCVAGAVYSGSNTTCTLDTSYCTIPAAPGNGTVGSCSQTLGGICNFQCNTGFVGANLARTCQVGPMYSGSPATCTLNTTFCALPPAPGNGTRGICDGSYLGVCHFQCNSFFSISADTRTCQSNGQFSGTPVTCTPDAGACPLPNPPANGNRLACVGTLNGVCHFDCNPGYSIDVENRTCNGSAFSLPASTCSIIASFCPYPPTPMNGSVGICDRSVGGTCNFGCDPGFTAQTSLQWTCQSTAAWLGNAVVCGLTPGFCAVPSTNGLNGVWGTCPGTVGSTCAAQCNTGYTQGGADPTCLASQSFSATTPCTLSPNFCVPPMYGNATVTNCQTTLGSTCVVVCNTGFVGGGAVTCEQTGAFGSTTACTPSQTNFCQLPLAPTNGVVGTCSQALAGTCDFTCNPGFDFTGASESLCTLNGTYLPPVTCGLIQNFCDPLDVPDNGMVANSCSRSLGGICSASCDQGYQASTTATVRVCQANQLYDGVDLTCSIIQGYCTPDPIPFGQRSDCNTTVGSQCEYTCNPGYVPARTLRTCQPSGSYSGSSVSCQLQNGYCTVPTDPPNGRVGVDCTGQVSTQCTVTCATGYSPHSFTTTCQLNGTYDVTDFPCEPVSCGDLPTAPEHGTISCTGSTYSSTCSYTCDAGYDLSSTVGRRCESNQLWSNDDPTCVVSATTKSTPQAIISTGSPPAAGLDDTTLYAIIGAAAALLLICVILVAVVVSRRRRGPKRGRDARDAVGSATIRLDSAQDGNADRVNMMLSARTTERIGAGAFSGVYKAKMEDNTWVAIKVLENTQELSAQEFHREVTILGQLGQRNHNNVVRLIFFCPNPAAIVTELCDGGSLYNILLNEKLDVPTRKSILTQVASGMAFLHDCNIVHLDLKPENILRGDGGQFKITDFGTSLILGMDVLVGRDGTCPPPRFVGTPQYSAPERFQNGPLDLKLCDVFSYGAMVWRAFSDKAPFEDTKVENLIQSYASKARAGSDHFLPPKDMPADLVQLMQKCLETEFRMRPPFADICDMLGVQRTRRASTSSSFSDVIANPVFTSMNDPTNSMNGSVNYGSQAMQPQGPRVNY